MVLQTIGLCSSNTRRQTVFATNRFTEPSLKPSELSGWPQMSDSASISEKGGFYRTALTALRLGSLLIIFYWCYQILAPFIPLVLWGAIITVAIYPLHRKLAARLGNRMKLSATLITLLGLMIVTIPVVVLTESLVSSSMDLEENR